MEQSKRIKHIKKKRKNPVIKFLYRIKRFANRIFKDDSGPKKFRPYLGADIPQEKVEEKKFKNTRANLKKYSKHQKKLQQKEDRSQGWNWKQFISKKKKKKHKRKSKPSKHSSELPKKSISTRKKHVSSRVFSIFKIQQSEDVTSTQKFIARIKDYFPYLINSTALFVIAYLLVYILHQFTILIVAANWKLESVLSYYDLSFNNQSPLWTRMNIIIVTFSGPAISLVLGLLFLRYFSIRRKLSKSLRLFMLWIGIHGINFFLGGFASGVSFDDGFGYVPLWLFFNVFWQILISLIFLFLLGVIGYYSVPRFLNTSYSIKRINKKNKRLFLIFQVILPWFFGIVILYLIRFPQHLPYDTANTLTLAFALIPMLFNNKAKPTKIFKPEKKTNNINIWLTVIFIVLLSLYRIGLNNGLKINLFYDFIFKLDITPI